MRYKSPKPCYFGSDMEGRLATRRQRRRIRYSAGWAATCAIAIWLGAMPLANAQPEQVDAITKINGESTASVVIKYFNAEDCADSEVTLYDLTLINGDGVSQAYLWAGVEQAGCEFAANRTELTNLCREFSGSPQTVGDDATIFDLTLQDLVDTGIVDCENTALLGQRYWIYSFRNENPGSTDVPTTGYSIAPFTVDVTPPQELNITSNPVQEGSSFTVAWESPTDSQSIPQYRLYAATSDDPEAALAAGLVATARLEARSITVSATTLTFSEEGEVFLYASAVDQAAVTVGDGNEGPLSLATRGIRASEAPCEELDGGCQDAGADAGEPPETGADSGGCSAASTAAGPDLPWLWGAIVALVWGRRRFH